jgi:hypothetical protein
MQLQPHFFFNALHTVSSLMMTDVAAAQRVIASLGELVRASIDHTAAQEVRLGEELQFVERYLEIQRARFRSRLQVEMHVPSETLDAVVPSLILQPLVENAIRHGTSRRAAPGHVLVSAQRVRDPGGSDGDVLEILVRDDGPGLGARPPVNGVSAPANGGGNGGGGIGVGNTRARLRQLYGAAHAFELADAPGGGVLARVRVPWRTAPAGAIAPARDAADSAPAAALAPSAASIADEAAAAAGAGTGTPWGARRWAAAVFAAWTIYGLLAAQEMRVMYAVEKEPAPPWAKLVGLSLVDAWGWALWSALVVMIARRAPIDRRNWRWLVPLHVVLAHLVAFAHLWFLRATGAVRSSIPFVDVHNLTILFWDVFAYIVVLAFTHAVVYRARWRARERESAQLAAEVAAAELELLRWRLQPRFLLDTLAAITRLVDREVERADRMVARLGDLLRSLLPHAPEQRATLRDELARLDAYLDIVALRDGRTVTIQLAADADVLDLPTPAMVLQPMAERALGLDAPRATEGDDEERDAQPACLWVFALREGGRLVLALRGDGAAGTSQRLELAIPRDAATAASARASLATEHGAKSRTAAMGRRASSPAAAGGAR